MEKHNDGENTGACFHSPSGSKVTAAFVSACGNSTTSRTVCSRAVSRVPALLRPPWIILAKSSTFRSQKKNRTQMSHKHFRYSDHVRLFCSQVTGGEDVGRRKRRRMGGGRGGGGGGGRGGGGNGFRRMSLTQKSRPHTFGEHNYYLFFLSIFFYPSYLSQLSCH